MQWNNFTDKYEVLWVIVIRIYIANFNLLYYLYATEIT